MVNDEIAKINQEIAEKRDALKANEAIVFVDGSYKPEDSNIVSYSWVELVKYDNGQKYFVQKNSGTSTDPRYTKANNVGGEILAAEYAIKSAQLNDIKHLDIYADYSGLLNWSDNSWDATKPETIKYKKFVEDAQKDMKIEFHKVSSHKGIIYNEEADVLARQALEK